jgi:hypothetical protein
MPLLVVAGRADRLDHRQAAEGSEERPGVGSRGDEVEVAAAVGHPARAASDLHPVGGGVGAERVADVLGDRERARQDRAAGGAAVGPRGQRLEDVLLRSRAEARHVAQLPRLGGLPELLERADPELLVQPARPLRPEAGDARDLDQAGRELGLQLLGGGDAPGLQQGGDLLRERAADAGQLLGPPRPRELRDRRARVADGLGGVAVRQHPVDDRAVQLVEVGELREGVGDLGVAHALTRVRGPWPAPG